MDSGTANNMLVVLATVGVAVLVAAVPWAFYIGGQIAGIAATLGTLEKRLTHLENRAV
jgi:hypothetical protein